MSDRLEELRRQRALQREHLDWIEREIAALEAAARQEPPAQPPTIPVAPGEDELQAEAILQEYVQPQASIEKRTKLGCLLYFAVALALLALGLAAVHLYSRAGRGR